MPYIKFVCPDRDSDDKEGIEAFGIEKFQMLFLWKII